MLHIFTLLGVLLGAGVFYVSTTPLRRREKTRK
jgi:hypothetical protein